MPEPDEIDCEGTDEIVCPYCGYEYGDSWEWFQRNTLYEDISCDGCGKEFRARADYSVTYYSEKLPHA